MGNYRDEIERFIYGICYQPIWTAISDYVSQHLSLLDLTYSRVKYPDSAYVEDMLLEFTKNIRKVTNPHFKWGFNFCSSAALCWFRPEGGFRKHH